MVGILATVLAVVLVLWVASLGMLDDFLGILVHLVHWVLLAGLVVLMTRSLVTDRRSA